MDQTFWSLLIFTCVVCVLYVLIPAKLSFNETFIDTFQEETSETIALQESITSQLLGLKRKGDIKIKVDIVIARNDEDIDWICEQEIKDLIAENSADLETRFFVYSKGKKPISENVPSCHMLKRFDVNYIINSGGEAQTYLHHITRHWDTLADLIVFLPGSSNLPNKKVKVIDTLKAIYKAKLPVVFASKDNMENLKDLVIQKDIPKSPIRPFGDWFTSIFGNEERFHGVIHDGVMSTSEIHIKKRSKEFYERLLTFFSLDVINEAEHYINNSWLNIFHMGEDFILWI